MTLSTFEKKIVEFMLEHSEQSFSIDQIAQHFNQVGIKKYKKLVKALTFLEHAKEIELTKGHRFKAIVKPPTTVTGTFRANAKGYGFITYDETASDLFVPPGKSGAAMHGDTVEAEILKHADPVTGRGSEAIITKIVERAATQMVGEFFAYNKAQREDTGYLGYVVPQGDYSEDVVIYIQPDGLQPVDHTICIVKIKEYPNSETPNQLVGLVAKEVGHKDAPGVDILAVLYQFGIPHEFPENVLDQANAIPQEISVTDLVGRVDLRDALIMTIDGADAKDLDDAISLSKNDDGTYQLGVHIADVSHYVTEGSAIDREAYQRGTSVYLTDRVVPMLPQRLSNGICSLHPHEDRLTMTCEMTINEQGNVLAYKIFPSVIHSSYRMTYAEVNQMIHQDAAVLEKYAPIVELVQHMTELHFILERKRHNRGALNFEAPESKIIVDEQGHPLEIQLRSRDVAEKLIESFMLAANETVALEYTKRQLPFMYRIHEHPNEEKMMRFAEFITTFGMVLRGNVAQIEPRQLQQALKAVEGEPFEQVVSTMMLRSMQQAKYSAAPNGHFGLAAADYTHFTSPIRRYPDLIVHRLIRKYLLSDLSAKERTKLEEQLPAIAEHSSKMERRAVDAERETDAIKKTEYMLDKVGEQFDGLISSVTSFGMFVQLPNTIEGLISTKNLTDDYYEFNQAHLLLVGKRTGKIYRIGQKVTIQVDKVDVANRTIDFTLVKAEPISMPHLPMMESKKANKKGKGQKPFFDKEQQSKRGRQLGSQQRRSKNKRQKKGSRNK